MKKSIFNFLLLLIFTNCVEPFDLVNEVDGSELESTLIVEGTLTNELKRQCILLSRPSDFEVVNEQDSIFDPNVNVLPIPPTINFERNAQVSINDTNGNQYSFSETSPGTYLSDTQFSAQQNIAYNLQINTTDGTSYSSTPETFEGIAQIDDIYTARDFNETDVEGVFIYIDASSSDAGANYYRYEYEETYKIIAPDWRPEDFVLSNYDPCALPQITYDLEIIFRDNEEGKVCYGTDPSEGIVQNTTLGLQENRATRFPVRFLNRENHIISHRYSLLVKQYVQSVNAYNYYRKLKSFSSSENVFSSVQPGLLEGNIKADSDSEKKVLGYFEVASVSEERVYFNYADLFPDEPLPDYAIPCVPSGPPLEHTSYCFTGMMGSLCPLSIVESVNIDLIAYYELNSEGLGSCPGPYLVTSRACGDCTVLGESNVPDFWIE